MRAVIYTRVSDDQEEGRSPAEQEQECRHVCEREGWTVVEVFSDSESASRYARKARPDFARLKAYLLAGKADVLVAWEGSRNTRDLAAFVELRDLCAERGILYSYSARTYDLTRTDDRFTTGLDALLAERESSQTRDRVLRAVRANADAGKPHGKLLYGYARQYELRPDRKGRVKPRYARTVIDEAKADVVREAARRVAGGESCRAVAADFNRRGIPTPREGAAGWNLEQVRRTITNPGYVAERVHRGKVVGPGDWPAILERDVFDEVRRVVSDPARKSRRDSDAVKHPLSGILRCGICGTPMYVLTPRGYATYTCKSGFCTAVRTTGVEAYVAETVKAVFRQRKALDLIARKDSDPGIHQTLTRLRRELAENEQAYRAGDISAKLAGAREQQLEQEIADLERHAEPQAVPAAVRELADAPDVDALWERFTVVQRRTVVAAMVDLRIGRTRRGERTFNFIRLAASRWRGDSMTWGERWT